LVHPPSFLTNRQVLMDAHGPNEEDVHAIIDAALWGNLEEVQRLVQQDRRLLDAHDAGWTPLTAASEYGHVEVLRYLLAEGGQVNLRDPDGSTPLDVACRDGEPEAASLLLAHGADAAAVNDADGRTPLMFASASGHADIVALLLAHGCGDIDHQDSRGKSALHMASFRARTGVMRALLGAGADPHVVDRYGKTPLTMAVEEGHEENKVLLQVRCSWRPSCITLAPMWDVSGKRLSSTTLLYLL
jgi:ankyrin repeat protein